MFANKIIFFAAIVDKFLEHRY